MHAILLVDNDGIGSEPKDRETGRFVRQKLNYAASSGDYRAEAILRIHCLGLGRPGMDALASIKRIRNTHAVVRLISPMGRHKNSWYELVLPNVWIDLPDCWHRDFKRLFTDSAFCKKQLKAWDIRPEGRVRDFPNWLGRVLEACLLDLDNMSPLLIEVANFRRDAALPRSLRTQGPFVVPQKRPRRNGQHTNVLRSSLRELRLHSNDTSAIPDTNFLETIDDPIDRLISLLLLNELEKPTRSTNKPLSVERFSRAQDQLIHAAHDGKKLSPSRILTKAWSSILTVWPTITHNFTSEEIALIEPFLRVPLPRLLALPRSFTAGKVNLIPAHSAMSDYRLSIDPLNCSIKEAAKWISLTLLCRCGFRASDLYAANFTMIHGCGAPEMTITVPESKTTGRRTLPIGSSLSPSDLAIFNLLSVRFRSEGILSASIYSILTDCAPTRRSKYDQAHSHFRHAIAPDEKYYVPTHIPRHIFATNLGLWYAGRLLDRLDHPFFQLWTDDSSVRYLHDSQVPRIWESSRDIVHLANQFMGHATAEHFAKSYCYAWPLICSAVAECNRPGRIQWQKIQDLFILSSDDGSSPADD